MKYVQMTLDMMGESTGNTVVLDNSGGTDRPNPRSKNRT